MEAASPNTPSEKMVKLSCWDVMGVPSTKAECFGCKDTQSFFGMQTYSRAEAWGKAHVCGVKVDVPRAGFLQPGEESPQT